MDTSKAITVLLIEDNPGDARLVKEALAEAGVPRYDLVWVSDLAGGLAHLAGNSIDAILLDLTLPDSRGYDTFERLHACAQQIPTILLTGLDDEALAYKAIHQGAQDYLVKGKVDHELLARAIRYAIERKRAEERIQNLYTELQAVRNINRLITKEKNRDRLLEEACKILTQGQGYFSAWLALIGTEGKLQAVYEDEISKTLLPLVEQMQRGQIPDCARRALNEPNGVIVASPTSACGECPLAHGFHGKAAMTARLEYGGKVYGVLTVYIPATSTGEEEQDLFHELSGYLAFALHTIEAGEEQRNAEDALRASEERYRVLAENMSDTLWLMDMNLKTTYISPSVTKLRGYTLEELNAIPLDQHMPLDSLQRAMKSFNEVLSPENLTRRDLPITRRIELEFYKKDGSKFWSENTFTLIRDLVGIPIAILGVGRDITECKQSEEERETMIEFLRLANSCTGTVELIQTVTSFFHQKAGCQAVGIRLRDGDDYPYFETRGFAKEFVQMENFLCSYAANGEVIRDSIGNTVLECMCGNVITGRFDPSKTFFTPRGSFWTNSTTQLLASTAKGDQQARTRNRCIGEGYESVALIPLCFGDERMGLLQFNDPRKGFFTLEHISQWERLADLLAITLARSCAKDALRRSETFLNNIIEHSPHAMWISDDKGTLIRLNQACRDLLHIRDDEVVGKYNLLQDSIVGEQGFLPLVKRVFENGEIAKFTIRYDSSQLKNLELAQTAFVILDTTISPVVDANRRVTNAIIQHVDVTERKRVEDTLRALLHRHEALLAAVPEIVMEVDNQKIYTWANQAGFEFFGADVIGKEAAFYFEGEQETYQTVMPLFHGNDQPIYMESWQRRKDGQKRLLAWWCQALKDQTDMVTGALSSARDITESRQAEMEIRKLNAELERRVEERTCELREAQEKLVHQERLAILGQLAGGVSNELRNPLGVIANAVYFLRLIQPNVDDKTEEYFSIIENETRTADKIINDLLDYSLTKSIDCEPMMVSELLQRVLERYPVPAAVTVSVKTAARLPPVYVDPRQMLQVLGNLVINAYQAMPEGGKLALSAKTKDGMIAISVQDTGVGIPPENMAKLFEPLFTTKMHGIGLGLAVSKKLVEANSGGIEVYSTPGKGATFRVYLPVYEDEI